MDNKKILSACQAILGNLDCLNNSNTNFGNRDYRKMCDYWKEISGFHETSKKIGEEAEEAFDELMNLVENNNALGFAFGFVVGQNVDLLDSELAEPINTVKQAIRDKALLPYFPRERKERRNP